MTDAVDYQAVVADLRVRRAALDQLIASVEALILGQGDPAAIKVDAGAPSANGIPAAIHADTFYGLSMIDAAKKFLRMVRRAQHTGAIAEALGKGGLKRPDANILSSILVRAAKGREVTKVGKGMWGLSEWYPPKSSKEADEEPQRKARKSKKAPKAKRQAVSPAATTAKKASKEQRQPAARAEASSKTNPGGLRPSDAVLVALGEAEKPIEPKDIIKRLTAHGLDVRPGILGILLQQHIKAGRIQRVAGTNTYRLAEAV